MRSDAAFTIMLPAGAAFSDVILVLRRPKGLRVPRPPSNRCANVSRSVVFRRGLSRGFDGVDGGREPHRCADMDVLGLWCRLLLSRHVLVEMFFRRDARWGRVSSCHHDRRCVISGNCHGGGETFSAVYIRVGVSRTQEGLSCKA